MRHDDRPSPDRRLVQLEESGVDEPVATLRGFPGRSEPGSLRLHPAIDRSRYMDIPDDVILGIDQDGDDGRVTVYVPASAPIRAVSIKAIEARHLERRLAEMSGRRLSVTQMRAALFPIPDGPIPEPDPDPCW